MNGELKTVSRRTRLLRPLTLLVAAPLLGSNCPPTPTYPDPIEIDITYVSNPEPALNEPVEIQWKYSDEDRAGNQYVEEIKLTFEGYDRHTFHGCPPQYILAVQNSQAPDCGYEDQSCAEEGHFTNECRQITTTFLGPVTITINVWDTLVQQWVRKGVTLRPADSFFRIENVSRHGEGGAHKVLDFTNFLAIYNDDEEPIMHDLQSWWDKEGPFYGRSPGILPTDPGPIIAKGGSFPILEAGFLTSPRGVDYAKAGTTRAAAVVFAGTLVFPHGEVEVDTVKTNEGSKTIPTTTWEQYDGGRIRIERLLAQVDLVRSLGSSAPTENAVPSNVRFGDFYPALVMVAFDEDKDGDLVAAVNQEPPTQAVVHQMPGENAVGTSNGVVAGASLKGQGWIWTNGGEFQSDTASLGRITWQNVPTVSDRHIDLVGGPNVVE